MADKEKKHFIQTPVKSIDNAPFRDWLYQLNPGESPPRGAFFKGKKPGRPVLAKDEEQQFFSRR